MKTALEKLAEEKYNTFGDAVAELYFDMDFYSV